MANNETQKEYNKRLVAGIGKVFDKVEDLDTKLFDNDGKLKDLPVKDLTALTTQDEVFKAVSKNNVYLLASGVDGHFVGTCTEKTATVATFVAAIGRVNTDQLLAVKYTATAGEATGIVRTISKFIIADPTDDFHAATKKYVDDHGGTVKDLTALTTVDEVFDAVEVNGIYKMPKLIPGWTSNEPLMVCFNKTATEADFNGLTNFTNALYTLQSKFVKGAAAPTLEYVPIYIGEPTINNHATTKKYVDDLVAAHKVELPVTLTLTFDDGTTEDVKVGK